MRAVDASRVRRAARWLVRQHLEGIASRPMPPALAPGGIEAGALVSVALHVT